MTEADRFWSHVDRSGGPDACWPWTAFRFLDQRTGRRRYGGFTFQGRIWPAHRVAWVLTYGPIPDGLLACHHCDNEPCCNPAHLFLGTPRDNMQDMIAKGRQRFTKPPIFLGEAHPRSKLTEAAVRDIRSSSASLTAMAARYGVDKSLISLVRLGRIWKHVA